MTTELSIGQVARRTGISARMLRHYDELGLVRPTRVSRNGYRWYDVALLPRLFRILALRRAGIGLAEIGRIIADRTNEAQALREHLAELRLERDRLAALISSIEDQVSRLEAATVTDPAGFRADYTRELAELAHRLEARHPGVGALTLAQAAPDMMTVADMEHLAAQGTGLLERLASLMTSGASVKDSATLDAVAEHHALVTRHVALSADAYRVLGHLYETDSLQRSIVAAVHPDLPAWLPQAIDAFVRARLGTT
ncbi:MerR family transcriptional regulator [Salana multivorans]